MNSEPSKDLSTNTPHPRQDVSTRDQFLILAALLAGLASMLFNWVGTGYVMTDILEDEATEKALSWGLFLQEGLVDKDLLLAKGTPTEADLRAIETVVKAGDVFRFKFFNAHGVIVYASREQDMGTTTRDQYFYDVVKEGIPFTKIDEKEDFGAKRKYVSEAYVPLMEGTTFRGAIEVYSDVTPRAEELFEFRMLAFVILSGFTLLLGAILGIMVFRNNQALRAAHGQLAQNQRLASLGQLSATVSHELRNPLATIRTSMVTIVDRTKGKDLKVESAIERIDRNISRCNRIISELLEYTRDRAPLMSTTDIGIWVASIVIDLSCPKDVDLDIQPDAGVDAEIDTETMRQVIINLFDNACQAMTSSAPPNGERHRLTVRVEHQDAEAVITFTDTGIGMSEDVAKHAFEPLYSTKTYGAGLGLPLVQKIIAEHRGTIDVFSTLGNGATFEIRLPISVQPLSTGAQE